MVFRKKKETVEVPAVEPVTSHASVGVGEPTTELPPEPPKMASEGVSQSVPSELSPEDKLLLEELREYRRCYPAFLTATDVANSPETVLRSEELTLKWAIYRELVKLNEKMERAV